VKPKFQRAVLIDYQHDEALAPMVKTKPPCLLPVGGKPLIQHWCERLSAAGVKELELLLSNSPLKVRQFVGDGARWGFTKTSYQYHPNLTTWLHVKKYLAEFRDGTTLVVNLSSLPISDLKATPPCQDFWFGHQPRNTFSSGIRPINSMPALWQANMDYLHGKIPPEESTYIPDSADVIAAPGSDISKSANTESTSIIGKDTVISEQVKLNSVIIGDDCLIEQSTHIKMSVVLDNTYIGSHSDLNYAIVDGPMIHRIDIDKTAWIDDPTLLARTDELMSTGIPTWERALALALFTITWPLTIFRKKRTESIKIPTRYDHNGAICYRSLKLASLCTRHSTLRKATWITHVLSGELSLFGINNDIPDLPDWASEQAAYCPGVISLADLNDYEFGNNDKTEILVANNYQLANSNMRNNINLLYRWLKVLFNPFRRNEKNEFNL